MTAIGRRASAARSAFSDPSGTPPVGLCPTYPINNDDGRLGRLEPLGEQRRAANGYLLWPLALVNIIRESNSETIWSRLHARQALMLGVITSIGYIIVLALPLIFVIAIPSISSAATIALYGSSLVADVLVASALLAVALRYSARAARGELFSIPLVTSIVDRWFRLQRP